MKAWLSAHLIYVRLFLIVCLLTAAYLRGHHDGAQIGAVALAKQSAATAKEAAQRANAFADAVQVARAAEQRQANAFAKIDAKFFGDMRYAQALSASTVAGLRAGTVRLSPTWRCPAQSAAGVPSAAADPGASAGTYGLQFESAGRIVGYVRQLQAERDEAVNLLEAERSEHSFKHQ